MSVRFLSSSVAAALVCAGAARGQVIELGAGGAVTVYSAPAVFSGRDPLTRESAPILPPPSAPAIGAAATSSGPLADAASAAALSPDLVEAVAWRESGGRAGRVSRRGAIGEMQLMPATARGLRVDPRDSRQNYRGGATYLAALMRRYDGDLQRALAAYNAGPGAVDRHGGVPPYRETRAYVAAVLDRLSRRADALGPGDAP